MMKVSAWSRRREERLALVGPEQQDFASHANSISAKESTSKQCSAAAPHLREDSRPLFKHDLGEIAPGPVGDRDLGALAPESRLPRCILPHDAVGLIVIEAEYNSIISAKTVHERQRMLIPALSSIFSSISASSLAFFSNSKASSRSCSIRL